MKGLRLNLLESRPPILDTQTSLVRFCDLVGVGFETTLNKSQTDAKVQLCPVGQVYLNPLDVPRARSWSVGLFGE